MLSYWTDPRIRVSLHPAFFRPSAERLPRRWVRSSPEYELVEKPGGFILRLDVPGFGPGELDVQVKEGVLRVSSQAAEQAPTSGSSFVSFAGSESAETAQDFSQVPSQRSVRRSIDAQFRMGEDIDFENITGRLENGLLELDLPRKPHARPRRVVIKSAADS